MDLWSLTRDQLTAAGVPAAHIFSIDICTASSPQFFSYRRDKVTGRQAGIIWIEEGPRTE
jgi:copper oxidase (laccase) domain-containing protein